MIRLENVSRGYVRPDGSRHWVYRGVDLDLPEGQNIGIVGRNGAGKTSMLKVLGGDAPPAEGNVKVTGQLGFLTQDPAKLRQATGISGLSHVLSGRGLDEAAIRLEKLRLTTCFSLWIRRAVYTLSVASHQLDQTRAMK